jgi:hypothetical protein
MKLQSKQYKKKKNIPTLIWMYSKYDNKIILISESQILSECKGKGKAVPVLN